MSTSILQRVLDTIAKQARWPSGAPGGKGGQFAPAKGGQGGGQGSGWKPKAAWGGGGGKDWAQGLSWDKPEPKAPPPGAKPHPKAGDDGKEVLVHYPSKPSSAATWGDPEATASFVPGSAVPPALNGVAFKPWMGAPRDTAGWASVPGQKPDLDRDNPFEPHPTKYTATGVIIREPDGRVWLTEPTNHFGGYEHTFPKGTAEPELSMQANAIKEAYEETGLKVRITGIAGDFEKTTSFARFYIAERVGGTPADMGWETQSVKLAAPKHLDKLLNVGFDRSIVDVLRAEQFLKLRGVELLAAIQKAKAAGKKGSYNAKQARWPAGTPLGGQWKGMDGAGLTVPPKIAGGLEGKNQSYYKKAQAAYAMAVSGQLGPLVDAAMAAKKKADADAALGKSSSHVKWHAQVAQFMGQLVIDMTSAPKAEAAAVKATGGKAAITPLSKMTYQAPKPGGSNPGGIYLNENGDKTLIKGNKQKSTGKQNAKTSDDRARNEVLAAKLMQAVGVGAPEMSLVDLEGEYGGGLGVASVFVNGAAPFSPKNKAHLEAIRDDYAVHAWLGNYDVLGMGYDNTVIKDGKAVNIDPGGAILFRAQGALKDGFDTNASEWETMRTTSDEQKAVFGPMSKSMLQKSAMKLALISDDTIKELVDAHGPKDVKGAKQLADTLIARRHAIIAKAAITPGAIPDQPPAPKPAPEPPKVAEAVSAKVAGGGTSVAKPTFNSGLGDASYAMDAAYAEGLHAKGDLKSLKQFITDTDFSKKSANGKKMNAYLAALVADLSLGQEDAVEDVAAGKVSVIGADGTKWTGDAQGVLQPVAGGPIQKPEFKDSSYAASASVLEAWHSKGKLDQLEAALVASDLGAMNSIADSKLVAYNKALIEDLKGAPATTSPAAVEPVPASRAPKPASKGSVPPTVFSAAKLPDSNSNAGSHNAKVDLIQKLHDDGDEKGLLALNYGTNTYGKKQAQLANDALASMGSVHQVTPGQKKAAHPALLGGAAQPIPSKPAPAPKAAEVKPAEPAKPIYRIPNPPAFANWNGAGKGLSSHKAFNDQNDAIAAQIKSLGDALNLADLQAATYQPIDTTGAPVGGPKKLSDHPSQHIKAYFSDVSTAMVTPYIPPKKMSAEEFAALPAIVKDLVGSIKDVSQLKDAAQVVGRYGVVGQADVAKFDGFPPKELSKAAGTLSTQSLYDGSMAGFKKLSNVEQQAIRDYTGSGYTSMNDAVTGKPSEKAKIAIKGMDKAAVEMPAGSVISRKFSFGSEKDKKAFLASVGKVVKDFGIISTSVNPAVWSGNIHLRITTAPGVKGLYVAPNPKNGGSAISKHPGEDEVILNYGTKFLVKKVHTKGFKDKAGSWGSSGQTVVELIALPEPVDI